MAAYLPSVPIATLQAWLGMPASPSFKTFLREKGAVLTEGSLDIRASRESLLQADGAS